MPKSNLKKIKSTKTKKTKNTKKIDKAAMERMRFSLSASFIGGSLSEFSTDLAALALSLRLMDEAKKRLLNSK